METMLIHLEAAQKAYLNALGPREASAHIRQLIAQDMAKSAKPTLNLDGMFEELEKKEKSDAPHKFLVNEYRKLPREIRNEIFKISKEEIDKLNVKSAEYFKTREAILYNEAVRQGLIKEAPPATPEEKV